MQNHHLQIKSTQKLTEQNEEVIEFFSTCKIKISKESSCIYYKESEITGLEGVLTQLEVFEDWVELRRSGNFKQKTQFKEDQPYFFDYTTPYGKLELEVRTQQILIQRDDKQINSIQLNYQIFDLTGNKFGDYELALQIQEANLKR